MVEIDLEHLRVAPRCQAKNPMNGRPEKESEENVRPVQSRPEPERDCRSCIDYRWNSLRAAQENRADERTMNRRAFDLLHIRTPRFRADP
jgi:hypothetical protein